MLKTLWQKIYKPPTELPNKNLLQNLIRDILFLILSFLQLDSIVKLGATSKYFNDISRDPRFWKHPDLSNRHYKFFKTMSYLSENPQKLPISVAFVGGKQLAHQKMVGTRFKLASSLTAMKIDWTIAEINKYSFGLYEDRSFCSGEDYNNSLLRGMNIILFFPSQKKSSLSEELVEFNKAVVKKISPVRYLSGALIFTLIEKNLLPKTTQEQGSLKKLLDINNYFMELPVINSAKKESYHLDQILYNLTFEVNRLIKIHDGFLAKQKQIIPLEETRTSNHFLPHSKI